MNRINLSEFRGELEAMSNWDLEIGLHIANRLLEEQLEKETDQDKRVELATAIYSIRRAAIQKQHETN